MSNFFIALSLFLIVCAIYWAMYWYIRPKVTTGILWRRLFLGNMIFGIMLVLVAPSLLMRQVNIKDPLLEISFVVMGAATLFHHLSIISEKRKWFGLVSKRMHGVVSHVVFFFAFGFSGVLGSYYFFSNVSKPPDVYPVLILATLTVSFSILGIVKGMKLRKL